MSRAPCVPPIARPASRQGSHMDFTVERYVEADGTVRLILAGELDIGGRARLGAALRAEELAGTAVVVVLDQLEYLDSTAVAELMDAGHHAREAGRRFAVTPGTGNVRHVLSVTGVLSELCGSDPRFALPDRTREPD